MWFISFERSPNFVELRMGSGYIDFPQPANLAVYSSSTQFAKIQFQDGNENYVASIVRELTKVEAKGEAS